MEAHDALDAAWRGAVERDATYAARCPKRCPNPSPPLGWTKEQIAASAAHGHCATPGAQCEHDDGHDGPHRNGGLAWHDPAVLYVGGVRA